MMDDFKAKFFSLINKQGHSKVPIVGSKSVEENDDDLVNNFQTLHEPNLIKENERPSDQEILESIDSSYFTVEGDFDACRNELGKISGEVQVEFIQSELQKLHQQHTVVSNQVLQMILEKQLACQEEFKRVVEVERDVDKVLAEVRSGREKLGVAMSHFTTASLGILANYRKRTLVHQLLRFLIALRTLRMSESRLQELLSEGDFPGAISLHREALGVAAQFDKFACVQALKAKLNDATLLAEQHLDVQLGKICYEFDEEVYTKLQTAYRQLGKTSAVMDQLHMHFTSAVHAASFEVLAAFSDLEPAPPGEKKEYAQLCKSVREESFVPCLLKLCKSMWYIVLSYSKVVQWHESYAASSGGWSQEGGVGGGEQTEVIQQRLKSSLTRTWNDIQARVSLLVLAANLSDYKFDDFLQVLAILHRMTQVGEELCGSESEELAGSVRTQCGHYFAAYHLARLDDLRVFLENEAWTPCPVRPDFNLTHLQEFQGLRVSLESSVGVLTRHDSSLDGSSVGGGSGLFARHSDPAATTPFDGTFAVNPRDEEILASLPQMDDPSGYFSDESEEETESRVGSSKQDNREKKEDGPLLTNTTLTVLRHCGKYLQMSKLLKSIAAEVVSALSQLFEYYLFTVYHFFATDTPPSASGNSTSIKLAAVLNHIGTSLIHGSHPDEESDQKVVRAEVSPVVELSGAESLNGLAERVVAVESLVFLSAQFDSLRPHLENLLRSQAVSTHSLDQFYSKTVSVSKDVRKPVYSCVSLRVVDGARALSMMSKVDWEVKDVMSQHSQYVDTVVRELQVFSMRLEEVKKHVYVPEEVTKCLWEGIAHRLSVIFVEGFSNAKKCSNGGRALMQLDFTQLVSKVERLSGLRPVPHREHVEAYVKAFYKPEEDLEIWIREHSEYTPKQLSSLVSCVCQSKKTRQRLIALIEEMDRSIGDTR